MEKQLNSYSTHIDDEALITGMIASASGVLQMVLNAAIELDIFEIIHKAAGDDHETRVSAHEIASQLPTNNLQEAVCTLEAMLQLLTSNSFLTCSITDHQSHKIERLYGLAPAGKHFIKDESGKSLAPYGILYCHIKTMDICSGLKDAVLEGGNLFKRFYGKPCFEYLISKPESMKVFNDAMGSTSNKLMKKVLETYDGFKDFNSIVNVGGNDGVALDMIISKYPHIHGINFDLPQVVQTAPSYNGIKHIGGDMFVEVPKGEAMVLKFILNDWNDDNCLKILKNCYKALPDKGKVIVMEIILPEIPQTNIYSQFASQGNFLMHAMGGGKQKTKTEFEALAIQAGFSEFKVVGFAYLMWIMEFIK